MSRFPLWKKLMFGIIVLLPVACNLTTVDPTLTPVPPTATVFSTATKTPTVTPSPTGTVRPTATRPAPSGPTATPIFRVSQPLPAAICGVYPNVDAANIRSGAGTNFPIIGVLPAGHWALASRIGATGWYQVNVPGTVVNGGWISNTVVDLQQPCRCTADGCTQSGIVPPTTAPSQTPLIGVVGLKPSGLGECVITAGGTNVEVYSAPQGLPPVIAILGANSGLPTFQYNSGRYAVNFSTETQQLVGWISEQLVILEGDCTPLKPPTVCSVQPSVGRIIDIYAEPRRDSKIVNALNERYTLPFISFNDQGWFLVNMGITGSGWIAPDEGVLVGPCDNGR
ncbi:MAG: hypothetical protein LCI00_22510 [Chloroflexi bacterium]|nr:hypothetical protein [Chloroflexota bacterium]MCC6895240.1 hypothetical protein [Anaerolineae bacterium]